MRFRKPVLATSDPSFTLSNDSGASSGARRSATLPKLQLALPQRKRDTWHAPGGNMEFSMSDRRSFLPPTRESRAYHDLPSGGPNMVLEGMGFSTVV